jgi:hypothetical protein
MLYFIATKRGLGVQLWGTYDDLKIVYEVIEKFWNKLEYRNKKGFENRDKLIEGFSFELRKGFEGSRLKRSTSPFSSKEIEYFGIQYSWVDIIFALCSIKYNMLYFESSKIGLSIILQIEFGLEKAMYDFDSKGATELVPFLDDAIYEGNEYIYQYMESINFDYFLLGGGKKAFRMLPNLLKRGIFGTSEYESYLKILRKDAKKFGCSMTELEIDYAQFKSIKW